MAPIDTTRAGIATAGLGVRSSARDLQLRRSAIMTGALDRPRMRLTDVSSDLVDFAITTYDVDPAVLAAKLPPGFEPELGRTEDGRVRAFVSSVTFLNTRFYAGFAPFVRLRCFQTNYRAYVRFGGERGAFFFATHLGSRFVWLPRIAWKLPWSRARIAARATWDGDRCARYAWRGIGGEGEELLVARGIGAAIGAYPSFGDDATNRLVLTHPLVGWLRRRDGRLATYSVWHAPLELEHCEVSEARFEAWERWGLVARDQRPCSVLAQRLTRYLVQLPPRALR